MQMPLHACHRAMGSSHGRSTAPRHSPYSPGQSALPKKSGCKAGWPLTCSGARDLKFCRPWSPASFLWELPPPAGLELAVLALREWAPVVHGEQHTAGAPSSGPCTLEGSNANWGQFFSFPKCHGYSVLEMLTKFWKQAGKAFVGGVTLSTLQIGHDFKWNRIHDHQGPSGRETRRGQVFIKSCLWVWAYCFPSLQLSLSG